MADKTVVAAAEAGITETLTAASVGGDTFTNDGHTILVVKNAHATLTRTLTFDVPNIDNFGVSGSVLDRAVAVLALTTQYIGPFSKAKFNDANNKVTVTYSSEADLTMQAVSVTAVA